MKDFLFINNWFDQKYKVKSDGRYPTFKLALNLLLQTAMKYGSGMNILETGTTRMVDDFGAGYSTVLFGDFVSHYGGHVWTVDIEPRNMDVCRVVTLPYQDKISYVVDDSHHYLSDFKDRINLLYLDSYDYPLDGSDPTPCQQHQLKEFKLAEENLDERAIVLLDDNNFDNGGKTKLTKDYLLEKDWRCLLDLQQSIWFK